MPEDVIDGRYQLRRLLGRGGMGEVWRAYDSRIGREVAVKIVTAGNLTDDALARFDREARIAGNVSGPSIVTVHDYGHADFHGQTVPYLVMELVAGRTIAERVRTDGPIQPAVALEWTRQICEALTAAHAANVVHRDIKPSNVMVTDGGAVKVLDFGIARFMEQERTQTGLTAAGMVIGSAEYMSPEQAQGGRVDARSDLYSLGCLLFFTITGRSPFEADSPVGLAYQHVNKAPEPPSRYQLGLPPELDALVLALLAKDPEERPADARTVGERVRGMLGTGTTPAVGVGAGSVGTAAAGAGAAGVAAAERGGTAIEPAPTGPTRPMPAPTPPMPGPAVPVGSTATPTVPAVGDTGATTPPMPRPTGPIASTPTPTAPSADPAGRDTGFWMPAQDTQVTELRQYSGDRNPPPVFPIAPTGSAPQPPNQSRRWFLTGAAAVVVGGAGVGTWLALNSGKSSNTSSSGAFTNVSGSQSSSSGASTPGSSGSHSATSTGTPSAGATSTGTPPAVSPGPHNPTLLTSLAGPAAAAHAAFSPDGKILVGCYDHGTTQLYDVSDPANVKKLGATGQHTDLVWDVAISPDGKTLATSSHDKHLGLWDIQDPRTPRLLHLIGLGDTLTGVRFSPDGAVLAVGTYSGAVLLIELSNPTDPNSRYKLSGHTTNAYSVAFSPDGKTLATGSFDGTVRLWDVSTPANATALGIARGHTDKVFDIAFHPGGKIVAAGSHDKTLILFGIDDPNNPTVLQTIRETDEVTGVAFSPDGKTLANGCGGSKQVRVYDVSTPADPHDFAPLIGHAMYTIGVAFSPDGKLLASASTDGSILLWRF